MKKQYSLLFILIPLLFSCTGAPKQPALEIPFKLAGNWQLENQPVIEQWTITDDRLIGKVCLIRGEDTTITETLRLFEKEGSLWYEATVPDQNEGKPVLFRLSEAGEDYWIFANIEHDFPDQVTYRFLHADTLVATIDGNAEIGRRSIEFRYHRLQ